LLKQQEDYDGKCNKDFTANLLQKQTVKFWKSVNRCQIYA